MKNLKKLSYLMLAALLLCGMLLLCSCSSSNGSNNEESKQTTEINPGENPGENPGGSEQKPSSGGCGGILCGGTLIAFAALAVVLTKQNKKGSLK